MSTTVARRYARALYEEARRENAVDRVDQDVDMIRQSLGDSRPLVGFFASPIISRDKKDRVVEALFKGRVQDVTLRFLRLLVDKKREALFPDIAAAYRTLRDAQLGIVEARARVATPLSEAEEKKLTRALEEMTGQRVRLRTDLDPALLGGLMVRVGDTVYDGSVRHQLATLRAQMGKGALTAN